MKFPLPFFLMVLGYTFMLVIDKVLFDSHAILGDDHGQHVDADSNAGLVNTIILLLMMI